MRLYTPGHIQTAHVDVALHEPPAARGRLGQLLRELRQRRAAHRRLAQPRADLGPRTVLAGCASNGGIAGPRSIASTSHFRQGFEHHQIGTLAQTAGVGLVHPRLAQPEGRLPGQHQPPEPGLLQLHPVHSVPVQQRRPQSAEPDGAVYPGTVEVPAQPRADVVLRAGHVHARPADAPGRHALRRHRHQLSRRLCRRSGLPADADAASSTRRDRPTRSTGRTSRRASAPRTTCSATARRRSR